MGCAVGQNGWLIRCVQAHAYLGNSKPYLEVGPVEREVRVVGRETLLSEMDALLKECP